MLERLRDAQPFRMIYSSMKDGLLPASFLLPEGGMRGVYLEQNGENLVVDVPCPASRADFALARFLTGEAVSCGASVQVDHDQGLDEQAWETSRQRLWHISLHAARGDESPLTLPCGPFALKVSADQRALPQDELECMFVAKAARYGAAFRAQSLQRQDGVIIGAFAFEDTLMNKNVQRVMYDPHGGTSPGVDVNVEEFMQALGGCEEHPGFWFLPGFDTQTEAGKGRLAEINLKLGVNPADHAQQPEFTQEMFLLIRLSPYFVFYVVAAADGEIDKKERETLVEIIRLESQNTRDPFMKKVLASSDEENAAFFNQAGSMFAKLGPRALLMANKIGNEYLGGAWPEFARWLYELGRKIASASGGGWFSSKISAEEKKNLAVLAEIFGVDASF